MVDGSAQRTIADIMRSPALTARPDETLATASARMAEHVAGAVVVVDDGGDPIGILTERDLIRCAAGGADPTVATLADWMTKDPQTASSDESAVDAFALLSDRGFRHIPVMEDGELVGMATMRGLMSLASIEPVTHPGHMEAPKGLAGVIVAETEVGDVRGQEGFYHYRQYSATDLAEKRSLEDVWYLMFEGELPTDAQREAFAADIRRHRTLPAQVQELLPQIAGAAEDFQPLDGLRTVISLVGSALGFQPSLDVDAAELKDNAMAVCAVIPTALAALYRLQSGEQPVEPHPDLGYAANYLYMIHGSVPEPDHARGVEQYQITTVDHGFNASTFTSRVITSTGADLAAAVVGGIGALSGPLHGGAPSRALDMLEAIGTPENTDAWVRDAVESGDRIMGFGHRVYKTEDPRSRLLRGVAERLGGEKAAFAKQVEQTVVDTLAELKPGRELYANVEFYAGVVMDRCGLPPEMFTPTFASSRVIGWCANILEQAADNRIIRPSARYVGPPPPQPVPDA
jgi:citrate synthase